MVSPKKREMLRSLSICRVSIILHGDYVISHQRRNKDGKMLTNEEEVRQRWKEHFSEVLNRPHLEQAGEVPSKVETIQEIPSGLFILFVVVAVVTVIA